MKARVGLKELVVAFLLLLSLLALAYAQPTGTNNLDVIKSERMTPKSAASVPAQAGNVSEVNINVTSVTKSWQGYFGNVTGYITLDDGNNNTMFEWDLVNPQGEIYASTGVISDWTSVKCLNYTADSSELNLTELETSLGMDSIDRDGVNETFTSDFIGSFYVGSVLIDSNDNCKAVYTYTEDAPQSSSFVEVLLTDSGKNPIYTTIMESNVIGFDNKTHDFQMLVGENGHDGDTSTTDYYFYVEIE